MQSLYRILLSLALTCELVTTAAGAATTNTGTTEAIINLPAADAWAMLTTAAGLESLGYTQVRVELQLGGSLQANANASLPSLNSKVLSLDTGHMLSFEPIDSATHMQWSVLYLTAMGNEMTQLRWLEFFPDEQSTASMVQQQKVRLLFDQLIRRYAPECEVCKLEKARPK